MMAGERHDEARALHLVMRPEEVALGDCRRFCRRGDAVVLIDTALLAVCRDGWRTGFPDGMAFAALAADARAHGVEAAAEAQGLALISDAELAGMVRECRHCLSWK